MCESGYRRNAGLTCEGMTVQAGNFNIFHKWRWISKLNNTEYLELYF